MALSGPGNGPSEATAIEAYERKCQGMSYREIAAAMAGPPHRCGGHSTARRWVKLGQALLLHDDEGRYDPMRKRRARREMAIDTFDRLRAKLDADLEAGGIDADAYHRHQREHLMSQARLGAWAAPPPATRVRITDSGRVAAIDPNLFASLAALPREEIDALLDGMLPDGRNQS